MTIQSDDEYFDRRWLHSSTREHEISAPLNLDDIRDFAYQAFDRLDQNANGFISRAELRNVLEHGGLDNRERSFVTFLLNNHAQIETINDDNDGEPPNGISRSDIEAYFKLIAQLLRV